jgi:hypothetical protein
VGLLFRCSSIATRVAIRLEARVPAEGTEERLLEGIVGRVPAGELAEIPVDLVAVLLVEAFEGRYRHGVHHLL